MQETAKDTCPVCRAPLQPQAILCVACGYHLKLGHVLATHVEHEPPTAVDKNPYASPQTTDIGRGLPAGITSTLDLTEQGARRAKAVVDDADNIFWMIPLACICSPIWVLMLPWYAFRLYSWHQLHEQFAELRQPSAFSEHARITARFPDARWRLLVGVVVGVFFWLWIGIFLLREVARNT